MNPYEWTKVTESDPAQFNSVVNDLVFNNWNILSVSVNSSGMLVCILSRKVDTARKPPVPRGPVEDTVGLPINVGGL